MAALSTKYKTETLLRGIRQKLDPHFEHANYFLSEGTAIPYDAYFWSQARIAIDNLLPNKGYGRFRPGDDQAFLNEIKNRVSGLNQEKLDSELRTVIYRQSDQENEQSHEEVKEAQSPESKERPKKAEKEVSGSPPTDIGISETPQSPPAVFPIAINSPGVENRTTGALVDRGGFNDQLIKDLRSNEREMRQQVSTINERLGRTDLKFLPDSLQKDPNFLRIFEEVYAQSQKQYGKKLLPEQIEALKTRSLKQAESIFRERYKEKSLLYDSKAKLVSQKTSLQQQLDLNQVTQAQNKLERQKITNFTGYLKRVQKENPLHVPTPLQEGASRLRKNLVSTASIEVRRFISRHPLISSTTISGLLGFGVGVGNSLASGASLPVAVASGSIWGLGAAVAPSAIHYGWPQKALRLVPGLTVATDNALSGRSQSDREADNPNRVQSRGILPSGLFGRLAGFTKTPAFWIVLVILLLLLMVFIAAGSFLSGGGNQGTTGADILIQKEAPESVPNKEANITYKLTLTYKPIQGSSDLTLIDPLPKQTTFVDTDSHPNGQIPCESKISGQYDKNTNQVSWQISNLTSTNPAILCLTVRSDIDDTWVINQAKTDNYNPSLVSNIGNVPINNLPPSADSCGGKYAQAINFNPLRQNFGDPTCTITKDDLAGLLKTLDPDNATFWFAKIIPCESSYNPNAFNPGSPDSAGAWGLVQMGRGKNGQYDHGDVVWTLQMSNAINYAKTILAPSGKNLGSYWQCAR